MSKKTDYPTIKIASCLSALCLVFCSCDNKHEITEQNDPTSARTVLVYMVAENSLSSYVFTDIQEMLEGAKGMSDNDNLIVYLDDTKSPRIYTITNKTAAKTLSELEPSYLFPTELNSASADVLKDVVRYAQRQYPADSYGIIFWSHASGWINSDFSGDMAKRNYTLRKSFGIDNGRNTSSNLGNQMNIGDMASVLSDFPKFDFIMFDACFMQSIEVVYELKECAQYIIGSPAEIPGPGAPYGKLISPMFAEKPNIAGIVNAYYEHYYDDNIFGVALSATDCSKLDKLADCTSRYIHKYKDVLPDADYSDVQNYFLYEKWNSYSKYPDCYEMQGIMQKVLSEADYAAWKQVFDETITIAQATDSWYSAYQRGSLPIDKEQFGGISMFLPLDKYADESFLYDYASTQWAKAIGLGE